MSPAENRALLTLALMAAFADGDKSEAERAEWKRIADSLDRQGLDAASVHREVLLKQVTLDQAVAALTTPESRRFAYEMAACVALADGLEVPAERAFLDELRMKLGLGDHPIPPPIPVAAVAAGAGAGAAAAAGYASTKSPAEMDGMILNYAILNGALELLPESLASMAIIPLQMKMVHRVGKAHGFELDRQQVVELLGVLGIGLGSQYVEQVGVKLVGRFLGGFLGGIAKQAVSSGMSFASTYALGHLAKRYYAGGRKLSTQTLRETYESILGEAKGLQSRYLPAIQEKARTLDVRQVLAEVGR
ncbi:hypothetical protein DSM104443_04255 [Usitatibacter rugosus]|uniref:Tellurite resistance protein TerB n=1 Tax=Usitatibacter rugosus TaxID=2732067 RepID=A0A6M4H101_9PROT|nr:GTPase [Usitatibacter rugosus]QJR13160.1 hypothetical protein DSM104443_04255 [Usitatibacter rugosus]